MDHTPFQGSGKTTTFPPRTPPTAGVRGTGDVQDRDSVFVQPRRNAAGSIPSSSVTTRQGLPIWRVCATVRAVPPSSLPRFRISVPSASSILRRVRSGSCAPGFPSAGSVQESARPRRVRPFGHPPPTAKPRARATSRAARSTPVWPPETILFSIEPPRPGSGVRTPRPTARKSGVRRARTSAGSDRARRRKTLRRCSTGPDGIHRRRQAVAELALDAGADHRLGRPVRAR